jgi:bacteriocin-like protein
MTTLSTDDLATITGGAQGWLHPAEDPEPSHQSWLHPKEVESETAGIHSAHSWVKDNTNIACTGGLWHGCPSPKKED